MPVGGNDVFARGDFPSADETPILHALSQHAKRSRLSLHVPGHHGGSLFPDVLRPWLGSALALDLTELPGLDNLQAPAGCIAASQRLASQHYQSLATLYSVNGSSGGVIASILALAVGRKILVAAPFHQSLWRAMVLADAQPVFCPYSFDAATLEPLAASPAVIAMALAADKEIACVFLTSPSYTGRVAQVRAIADVAHEAGVPLVVDEAHGAHFGLHPELPVHSVSAGADVVVQSVHKMLPALTQTAWIHIQGPHVDVERMRAALNDIQTTSPSYLLLASLDAAQYWLRREGSQTVDRSLEVVREFGVQTFKVPLRDPFRLWLPTGCLAQSDAIAGALATRGIFVEYANSLGVLCMLSLQMRRSEMEQVYAGLAEADAARWSADGVALVQAEQTRLWRAAAESVVDLELTPRASWRARRTTVSVFACAGQIAGQLVVPYPPGIPLLFPGERIRRDKALLLQRLYRQRAALVGLGADGTVVVLGEGG